MAKIIQLLVAAMVVQLSMAVMVAPRYKESVQELGKAIKHIMENLLSMEDQIPFLDDSRRHFAEIIHDINYHAVQRSGGHVTDYQGEYYQYLNVSAPEAISNPNKVITEIKKLFYDVQLTKLIDSCKRVSYTCNELISNTVVEKKDKYGKAAAILIAVGEAAAEYNKLNIKFEAISKDLTAQQYVITSHEELEHIIRAVEKLHLALKFTKY